MVVWCSECGARRLRGGLVCSCPFHNMQLGFECIFSMRRGKLRDARHLILRGFILMHLISSHITNSHAPHITSFHQLSCTSYHELSPTLMHLTSHRFHQLSCTSHHIAFTNSHHENPRARGAVSFLTRFPHQKDPPEKSFWSCSAGEILLLRLLGLETTQQGNPTPPGGGFLRST